MRTFWVGVSLILLLGAATWIIWRGMIGGLGREFDGVTRRTRALAIMAKWYQQP